ncbi:MAG: ribokinase [Hyphomicrobiaceae bacterium]
MIRIFGSINIDLTFQLSELPSVGETVLTPTFTEVVGGKGANQAVAARRAGAEVGFVGCVGRDALGPRALAALSDEGIDIAASADVEGKTGLASIWVDSKGENMIAVASGANGQLTSDRLADSMITSGTLVVLQMEVPRSETEAVIARAKQAGAKVLLNLAPALPISEEALGHVDILVLNEVEADTLCHRFTVGAGSIEAKLKALASRLAATVIITLGARGVVALHDGEMHQADALSVEPVDTTGAGDCFVGVFAAGLDTGMGFDEALSRAAAAASLACTVVGTLPSFPRRERIDEALASRGQ